MKKQTITLSELTHQILMEKKMNRWIAEITRSMSMLSEGMPSTSGIDSTILKVSKDLDKAGDDVSDENVQAAMLAAQLAKGGSLDAVTAQDVEKFIPQGTEKEDADLQEAHGGALVVVEGISLILGNAALIEAISKTIQKVTGKATDPNKVKLALNKVSGFLKKATGFPMKIVTKAIEWIIGKMGGGDFAQKVGALTIKIAGVAALLVIGVTFFPVGGISLLGIISSITALIGKGFELAHMGHELAHELKAAGGTQPAVA